MAKLFISTNQITQAEVNRAEELSCDGVHFIGENSPDVTDWSPLRQMNDSLFITEEGANDREWLLNPSWPEPAPRYDFNVKIARAAGFEVDSSLEYVENPRTMLDPPDITECFDRLGYPIMLLARSFTNYQETKTRIRYALTRSTVRGIVFELNPSAVNVKATNIVRGMREVLDANKRCSILLPPWPGTTRYEYDIKSAITELRKSGDYRSSRLSIILACYRRSETGVKFFGKHNSIEAARRWILNNT